MEGLAARHTWRLCFEADAHSKAEYECVLPNGRELRPAAVCGDRPERIMLLPLVASVLLVIGLGAGFGAFTRLGGVVKRTPDMLVPNGWSLITGIRFFCSLVRCSTRRWSLHEASNWLGEPSSGG